MIECVLKQLFQQAGESESDDDEGNEDDGGDQDDGGDDNDEDE